MLIALSASLVVLGLLGSLALTTVATTRPLQGRIYIEGVVGEPQQLNPLAQGPTTSQAERDLAALLFEGLTQTSADGRIVPALAERWTTSSAGRIYTFTLRADRFWHDGAPVTADDVLYTVRGVQNAAFPGDPALAAVWRNVLVQKRDERTIQFELGAPLASFPSIAQLPILPAHILRALRPDQWPNADFSRRPVGTGRYQLQALDAQQALLVPFGRYSGAKTAVDNLLLRFYPTADAASLALARREVQSVATIPLAGRRMPEPPQQTQRAVAPLGAYTILTFNLQQPPLDDIRFRQALALGLNRDLLITEALGGQAQRLDTPILPQTWAADPTAKLPDFRRSAAQQALGALGYVDRNGDGWLEFNGQRLTLPLLIADTSDSVALAGEIARQLREIGVGLDVRRVPAAQLQDELAARNFTLALHSWNGVGSDPDVYALWHSSRADGGANYAGLRDSEIDRLLAEGRATTDETQRKQIYSQFQRRWVELIPSLPLYQTVLVYDLENTLNAPLRQRGLIVSRADRFNQIANWTIPPR